MTRHSNWTRDDFWLVVVSDKVLFSGGDKSLKMAQGADEAPQPWSELKSGVTDRILAFSFEVPWASFPETR